MRQETRFCTTADGVRIAYATCGQGPPLVKAANWLNHLEFDWQSPIWRHWFEELGKHHTLVRYDERGNGLSDWDAADLSFEAFVRDLEAVVDAAGLERSYLQKGMFEEAIAEFQEAVRWGGSGYSLYLLAHGYATAGKRDEALKIFNEGKEEWSKRGAGAIAVLYADLGEKDQAFAWLEKAYQIRETLNLLLKVHPVWNPLRDDPSFQDLLRRMNFPEE